MIVGLCVTHASGILQESLNEYFMVKAAEHAPALWEAVEEEKEAL